MGNSASTAAVPALCAALGALELVHRLDRTEHTGAGAAAAQAAPPLGAAARALLPLVAVGGFFASMALVHGHLRPAGARRLPGPVAFALCAFAGLLHFLLFVAPAPGGAVDCAALRALGLAALRALLLAASAASFYLGMLMVIVGHIRAGGEGGGGAVAVAGEGRIEAPVVRFLAKGATAATVTLLFLTAMAVGFI